MSVPEIVVTYARHDGGGASVSHHTAVLSYADFYRGEGPGWMLVYMRPSDHVLEDCYIGGRLFDVDWALERARWILSAVHAG